MRRNHGTSTSVEVSVKQTGLSQQETFHEAGHVAAIYIRNKQQQLPPVYFQIIFRHFTQDSNESNYVAKLEGGRLIEHLPYSMKYLSETDRQGYLLAFEADIVNLLAGPLAEAKYVADRDGEDISRQLLNFQSLSFYGGASDMEMVEEYIQCILQNSKQRQEKIEQLFQEAFKFIDNSVCWRVINILAQYIANSEKKVIPYSEIIFVIENALLDKASNISMVQKLGLASQYNNYIDRDWF